MTVLILLEHVQSTYHFNMVLNLTKKNDDGVISSGSFPATFDITFDFEMNIEAADINVGTSGFFED